MADVAGEVAGLAGAGADLDADRHVTRRDGQWLQESAGRQHEIQNPVTQAQDCRHILTRYARRGFRNETTRSAA